MAERRRGILVTVGLIMVLVALWVVPVLLGSDRAEPFAGTDAQATALIEDTGYQPWITPVFDAGGEVASGLFALQAAVGAAVVAYIIGRWHGRSLARRQDRTEPIPD
jgi:cobalt/nickel transport protein